MSRQLLFSVTAKDCEWSYTKGSGKGGQKKNKTSSAVHCIHKLSGAHGYAEDSRSQLENKQLAFKRMVESKEFQKWQKLEVARLVGDLDKAENYADREISNPDHLKIEVRYDDKWKEITFDDKLED